MSQKSGLARTYRLVDIKRLFALSFNQCALPGCDERLADPAWASVLGEVCHIHGLNPTSARYLEGFSEDELNSYENLILLCRNCHVKVDSLLVDLYPADTLLEIKEKHERRQGSSGPWCDEETLLSYIGFLADSQGLLLRPPPEEARPRAVAPAEGDNRHPEPAQPTTESGGRSGVVKWFNSTKGFGFITDDVSNEDVFVHQSQIRVEGYRELTEGQRVTFELIPGNKGNQAGSVKPD